MWPCGEEIQKQTILFPQTLPFNNIFAHIYVHRNCIYFLNLNFENQVKKKWGVSNVILKSLPLRKQPPPPPVSDSIADIFLLKNFNVGTKMAA